MQDPRDGDVGRASPLSITGDARGVLCLHGLTGTPFEVAPLAEGLGRAGFSVEAPLLAGHAGTLDDLAATRWPDWLASAEAALDKLRAAVADRAAEAGVKGRAPPRVALVGFSMGGLLSLRLARLRPDNVAAMVIMSAPLRLRRYQVNGIRALSLVPGPLGLGPLANVPKLGGCDVSDPEMKRLNPTLPAMPVPALASLLDLMTLTRADLPAIRTPALVVHGRRDHTVPMEDSLELTGCLGSDIIERLWLEQSFHLVVLDVERALLLDAVGRFLGAHLA